MGETARMLRSLLLERSRLKGDWERLGAARQSLLSTHDALVRNASAIADLDLAEILRERGEEAAPRPQGDLSEALISVLTEWGFITEGKGIDAGDDLAEAIRERGAWRLVRDIRDVSHDFVRVTEAP